MSLFDNENDGKVYVRSFFPVLMTLAYSCGCPGGTTSAMV